MKKYFYFFIFGVLIALGLIFLIKKNTGLSDQNLTQDKRCYRYQESDTLSGPTNHEYIELVINKKGDVVGIHELVSPYRKSIAKINGHIVGEVIESVVRFDNEENIWDTQERGTLFQMLYKVQNDKLYVGYQQVSVPRFLASDGVYRYEDSSYVIFNTDNFYLNRTTCRTEN